jgi:hypothetical protein
VSEFPGYVFKPVADIGNLIDIALYFGGGSQLKFFRFIHRAKLTAIPGTVARDAQQQ